MALHMSGKCTSKSFLFLFLKLGLLLYFAINLYFYVFILYFYFAINLYFYVFILYFCCLALLVVVMECLKYTTKGGKETTM